MQKNFLEYNSQLSEVVEVAFKNLFQSYTFSFNKQHARRGNLFYKPFKRILVDKESQLTQAVIYIHANPLKHSDKEDFEKYKWSSYQSFLSDASTKVSRNEILEWFGGKEAFRESHARQAKHYYSDLSIEE